MPSFQGTKSIILQPTTNHAPYTFTFEVCSSATANDGEIPYGDSVASCTVKAYDADGTDVTSEIVHSSSLAANVVTVELDYPASSGAGKYKLTFQYTTTNGYSDEVDFARVVAKGL